MDKDCPVDKNYSREEANPPLTVIREEWDE